MGAEKPYVRQNPLDGHWYVRRGNRWVASFEARREAERLLAELTTAPRGSGPCGAHTQQELNDLARRAQPLYAAGASVRDVAAELNIGKDIAHRIRGAVVELPTTTRPDLIQAAVGHAAVVAERFGDPAAVEAEDRAASLHRQPGSVPACPVCGYQPGGMGRYRLMRPHNERRVGRDGIRDTGQPCPGAGELPEYVIPFSVERTP